MSDSYKSTDRTDVMDDASRKKRGRRWKLSVFLLVVLVGALVGFLFFQNSRSHRYFLSRLERYDANPELLESDWMLLSKRAQTLDQYLSLLKRLQANELEDAYTSTLDIAREKNLGVILDALFVRYHLKKQDLATLRNSTIDRDELWKQYPALMRYYAFLDKQLALSLLAKSDEILSLIRRVSGPEGSKIQDYHELAGISKNEVFPFLISMYHVFGKDKESAQRYFNTISGTWRSEETELVQRFNNYLTQTQLSNQEKIDILSREELFRQAQSLYKERDLNTALLYLKKLEAEYPYAELSDQFFHFYIWLVRNYGSQQDIEGLGRVFVRLQKRLERSVALTLQFLLYLYKYDRVAGEAWLTESKYVLDQKIRSDNTFQFLKKLFSNNELVHLEVFLWQKLEEHVDNPDKETFYYWLESMARHLSFFSSPTLDQFFQRFEAHAKRLYPYMIYADLSNEARDTAKIKDLDLNFLDSDELPWWHSYNLASWSISQKDREKAYQYLIQSESKLSLVPTQKISVLLHSQYIRLALLENDFEQARSYLDKLKTIKPTYPHIRYLEEQINFKKLLSQDEEG